MHCLMFLWHFNSSGVHAQRMLLTLYSPFPVSLQKRSHWFSGCYHFVLMNDLLLIKSSTIPGWKWAPLQRLLPPQTHNPPLAAPPIRPEQLSPRRTRHLYKHAQKHSNDPAVLLAPRLSLPRHLLATVVTEVWVVGMELPVDQEPKLRVDCQELLWPVAERLGFSHLEINLLSWEHINQFWCTGRWFISLS